MFLILLLGLLLLAAYIFGFFDSNTVKVDEFSIKKPFLYKSMTAKNRYILNNEKNSVDVAFMGTLEDNIILYTINKLDNDKYFIQFSKRVLFVDSIAFDQCYITAQKIIGSRISYSSVDIASYPYVIHFTEINKEREAEAVQQFCQKKNKVYLNEFHK